MIRFSVLICLSVLLFSSSAKPYRPRDKVLGKAIQDTMESDYFNGKIMLGMKEVEPLEDMDNTDYDIDPSMSIYKVVKDEVRQKYNRPEEDKDAIYHPFELKLPADSKQSGSFPQPHDQVRSYDKPEEDRDDLYHGVFDIIGDEQPMGVVKDAQVNRDNVRPMYLSPEEDKDHLYHPDLRGQQPDQHAPLNMYPIHHKKVHTEPEIDLDGVYHQ
nr:uncharacterized protein si:ch211-217g15.3 [Misgurnus anguillicaudatus]